MPSRWRPFSMCASPIRPRLFTLTCGVTASKACSPCRPAVFLARLRLHQLPYLAKLAPRDRLGLRRGAHASGLAKKTWHRGIVRPRRSSNAWSRPESHGRPRGRRCPHPRMHLHLQGARIRPTHATRQRSRSSSRGPR